MEKFVMAAQRAKCMRTLHLTPLAPALGAHLVRAAEGGSRLGASRIGDALVAHGAGVLSAEQPQLGADGGEHCIECPRIPGRLCGHCDMAVRLKEQKASDAIIQFNGKEYIYCDPTYIGADVGIGIAGGDIRLCRR